MNQDGANLVAQMEECAIFFYQNKEQKAYDALQSLLPQINDILQEMNESAKVCSDTLGIVAAFVEAIQRKHTLALADLLAYDIQRLFREMGKQP
ncbi:MAG: hypothetical protein HFI35_08240 [Roseburia sp.]|jgi:hypothetical protein|nr:hypothetical protein [Roseburia sp.]